MRLSHLAIVLSLTGCLRSLDHGPIEPSAVPDAQPAATVATDGFRFDEAYRSVEMKSAIRSADITTSTVDAWVDRTTKGAQVGGGGRVLALRGASGKGYGGSMGEGTYEDEVMSVDASSVAAPAAMPTRTVSGRPHPAPSPRPRPKSARPSTPDGYADMREDSDVAERRSIPQNNSPLRAGKTDDNVAFGEYLEFLATWTDRPGVAGNHVPMDVSDRKSLTIRDGSGSPLPGARVSVIDRTTDELIWSGTSYGDGIAPFYATLAGTESTDLLVQAEHHGVYSSVKWNGSDPLVLDVDAERATAAVDLDVVFVIDTTGSMSDEISRIKATLLSVTERVRGLDTPVDLRYGAVLYRDIGDEYLTRHTPLTPDVKAFDALLKGIQAGGGGDGPESLNQGLSIAVTEMDWRPDAAKMVFLVADAPPHMDYQDDSTYADAAFRAMTQGIRIHTVAASGLDDFGSLVFRQTAQLTRGDFVFIEYGSSAASAADHGVTGPVGNNNLDSILFAAIEDEVVGWGKPEQQIATR